MCPDDQASVMEYLVLGTWEAITLLGKARERSDADGLSELITKAEAILIAIVSELAGTSGPVDTRGGSPGRGKSR